MKVEEVVPSAARTVESLRNVGYETAQAIADLVDNSIAARATKVEVDIRFDADSPWVRVADNGEGMYGATLTESMRYGSERDYELDDLGRFGFGLKTASTSQCRRVSVASRVSPNQARIEARCLDLGHIERTNRWEILVLDPPSRPERLVEALRIHPGTVVFWEQLDRILAYKDPFGGWAQRRMLALAEEVDTHLGMVFHRFLSGQVRGRRLAITVNGSKVMPWDPFCIDEKLTEALPGEDVELSTDRSKGIVRVSPYVLPPQADFSSDVAWRRASGPTRWNRQQGFYVYRANRLIQSGGWCGLRTLDEHSKLARISLDFFPSLDDAFGINISKAIVTLPQELRERLEPTLAAATRRAQERYRSSASSSPAGRAYRRSASATGWRLTESKGDVGARAESTTFSDKPPRETTSQPTAPGRRPRRAIEEAAARASEAPALKRIVDELKRADPEVADALGW